MSLSNVWQQEQWLKLACMEPEISKSNISIFWDSTKTIERSNGGVRVTILSASKMMYSTTLKSVL